jgi:hypothetical protein
LGLRFPFLRSLRSLPFLISLELFFHRRTSHKFIIFASRLRCVPNSITNFFPDLLSFLLNIRWDSQIC